MEVRGGRDSMGHITARGGGMLEKIRVQRPGRERD